MLKQKILKLFNRISKEEYDIQRQISTIAKSRFFDEKYYLYKYPNVKKTNLSPAEHYLRIGWGKGYNPSEKFNTKEYLKKNPDVESANVCPLYHYERFGKNEGRYSYSMASRKKEVIKRKKSKEKGVIYTCITGNYDDLIDHQVTNENFDYVCFTDNEKLLNKGEMNGWKIKPLKFKESDNTRNARWHKIHPHILFPEYKISLWIDGNIDIITDKIFTYIEKLEKSEDVIFAFKHPLRDCIYDEGDAVMMIRKDIPSIVREEMKFLSDEKYPQHKGLFETGIIFRKHMDEKLISSMNLWWKMIIQFSKRDQLAFTYSLWKNGLWISSVIHDNKSIENSGNFIIRKSASHNSKSLFSREAKSISIIIPVYNGLEDVKNLFKSIDEASFSKNVDIIIIDDCSKNDTKDYLKELQREKGYKLYRNNKNSGFVKSCNIGLKQATGDIIILLNSDTMVPKTLEKKVLFCFNHKKYIGVASPISSDTGLWKIDMPKDKTVNDMDRIVEQSLSRKFPDILCPEGFCFCIRKEVIEEIGYLDEVYGMGYCEETDFALRALNNGWKCVLIDNLFVYHKHHVSFGADTRKAQIKKNSEILWSRWRKLFDHYAQKIDMRQLVNDVTKTILSNITECVSDKSNNVVEYGNNIKLDYTITGKGNKIVIKSSMSPSEFKIQIFGDNNEIFIDSSRIIKKATILVGSKKALSTKSLIHIKKDFSCASMMVCLYHSDSALKIGEDCMFSSNINIRIGELPHLLFDNKTGECLNKKGQVLIGNHVWFGESVTILKNGSIGDDSIVGFGSIVTKNFYSKKNVLIAGNPAEIKKKDIHWERNITMVSKKSKFFSKLPKFK